MANFFEQFHDAPEQGAPAGTANYHDVPIPNYFSQFHPADAQPPAVAPQRLYVSPSRPDNGIGDAIVQGVKQGASAGFSDEAQAMADVGGQGKDAMSPAFHATLGLLRYLAQDPEAHEQYNAAVLREREAIKAAEEHHGFAKGVGEFGGALATLPLGGEASQAAGWLARALAAAKQGAVYGGLTGAGEGEGAGDTVKRGAAGTVLGGVLGGVGAPLIEGAGKVAQKLTEKLRNTYRGAVDPEAEAARQYAAAYKADRIDDPTFQQRMTPAEFRGSPDARLMDLGGGHMRRLADASGIISPGGEMKLKGAIDDRFKGQTNRFTDWFRSHFNYPDAYGQKQALTEVGKKVTGPAYGKAFADGAGGVWSPELRRLAGAPSIQKAAQESMQSLKDRGITEGFRSPRSMPLQFDPDTGMASLTTTANGNQIMPDLRFWDQVKRHLDTRIDKATANADKETVGRLTGLKNKLVEELDRRVGSYKTARQGAAGFFGADDALQAGVKFVSDSKMGLTEARATLAKMSPAERRLFQDGFVDEYLRAVINKTGDNRDVLLKIANNPEARGKLELVMGRERMQVLEAKIRVEQMFDQVRKAVQGQSITAKRLYDLGMAGGAGLSADGGYNTDPKEIAYGAVVAALSSGGKRINAQVATRLVDMMLSRDPMVVEKGFRLISSDPKWLDALRDADTKIGRVISGASPTGTALQLVGAGRADAPQGRDQRQNDQPRVQRPLGR